MKAEREMRKLLPDFRIVEISSIATTEEEVH